MNTPSPLIPRGATPPRVKNSLYIKILMVLSVHVVVIGGMLLQGCKDTAKDQAKQDSSSTASTDTAVSATPLNSTTAPAPTDMAPTANPNLSNTPYAGAPVPAAVPQPLPPITSLPPKASSTDLNPPPAPGEAREYVIAKGDTLGAIARKNGLSVKALAEANPNINPKKLQIGQKVQIPAGSAAVTASAGKDAAAGVAADAGSSEVSVYVVKNGDILLKIAKAHGTSVKKIMAMNDLKSTSIRAGQKLKLPAAKTPAAEPAAAPATTAASVTPMPLAAPIRVSATTPAVFPVASN